MSISVAESRGNLDPLVIRHKNKKEIRRGRPQTHGLSCSPEYRAIRNAKQRCSNQKFPQFKDYGGRGIQCRITVEQLIADIGHRPSPNHSLDRIDLDGHYESGNLRWATRTDQARNRRNVRIIEFRGQCLPITTWATVRDIPARIIRRRLDDYEWSVERALLEPACRYEKLPSEWAREQAEFRASDERKQAYWPIYVKVRIAMALGLDVDPKIVRLAEGFSDAIDGLASWQCDDRVAFPSLDGSVLYVAKTELDRPDKQALADEILDRMRDEMKSKEEKMQAANQYGHTTDLAMAAAFDAWREGIKVCYPDRYVCPWNKGEVALMRDILACTSPEILIPAIRFIAGHWADFTDYLSEHGLARPSFYAEEVLVHCIPLVHRAAGSCIVNFHMSRVEQLRADDEIEVEPKPYLLFPSNPETWGIDGPLIEEVVHDKPLTYLKGPVKHGECRWFEASPITEAILFKVKIEKSHSGIADSL